MSSLQLSAADSRLAPGATQSHAESWVMLGDPTTEKQGMPWQGQSCPELALLLNQRGWTLRPFLSWESKQRFFLLPPPRGDTGHARVGEVFPQGESLYLLGFCCLLVSFFSNKPKVQFTVFKREGDFLKGTFSGADNYRLHMYTVFLMY